MEEKNLSDKIRDGEFTVISQEEFNTYADEFVKKHFDRIIPLGRYVRFHYTNYGIILMDVTGEVYRKFPYAETKRKAKMVAINKDINKVGEEQWMILNRKTKR